MGPGFILTYPALEIESEGVLLTQAPAIVEYLVELGSAQYLLGESDFEKSQVDQWTQFIRMQTLTLAKALSGVVFGTVEMEPAEFAYLNGLFKENAKTLNNHLKQKEWICGTEKPTIADYQLAIAEIELQ